MPSKTILKTRWRCHAGHEWLDCYDTVADRLARQSFPCPCCATGSGVPKIAADYHALADERGIEWTGELPPRVSNKTFWRCPQGHTYEMNFNGVRAGYSCPQCESIPRINGFPASKPQRALHDLIGGEINYRAGRYAIDIAFPDEKIAVEYDCDYWHDAYKDEIRNRALIRQGWRILRIKSRYKLPESAQINDVLTRLRAGETYLEIQLSDWRGV